MAKKYISCFALLILCVACPALAMKEAPAPDKAFVQTFHPPQTEAERALDRILELDRADHGNLTAFIWKLPDRDRSKDEYYSTFFTPGLQDAWEKYYLGVPEEPEGGRYVGFSFIGCGQESLPQYFYMTVRGNKKMAYIAVSDDQGANDAPDGVLPPYRMIKEKGSWKLDGAKCFNDPATDFHYTR